jgi:hypothetical protein
VRTPAATGGGSRRSGRGDPGLLAAARTRPGGVGGSEGTGDAARSGEGKGRSVEEPRSARELARGRGRLVGEGSGRVGEN